MSELFQNYLPGILDNLPLFPEQASTLAGHVDALYLTWVLLSVFFSALIAGATVFMMLRYHRRHENSVGVREVHAPAIEVIAIVVPFVIVMVMFAWGAWLYVDLRRPPADAVEYFAFGKQWMWKYQHPTGKREINHLTIPVDTPIKLTMTSEDVIHAFSVPNFRVKQDVLPGRYTTLWFEATETGTFRQYCAEYCGSEHSLMGGTVTVLEQEEYEAWLREGTTDALTSGTGTSGAGLAGEGEQLFATLACNTCHESADLERGPSLHGLYGSEVRLADGTLAIADDAYLRESILNPRAKVRAGFEPLMPTFQGQVGEEQLMSLILYVKRLGDDTDDATPSPDEAEDAETRMTEASATAEESSSEITSGLSSGPSSGGG